MVSDACAFPELGFLPKPALCRWMACQGNRDFVLRTWAWLRDVYLRQAWRCPSSPSQDLQLHPEGASQSAEPRSSVCVGQLSGHG